MDKNIFAPVEKNVKISRTFHLYQNQLKPLQDVSKQLGISQSEMVRLSISYFIDEYKKQGKKNQGRNRDDN